MAPENKPFYIDLPEQAFKEFAHGFPLLDDEALLLEGYAAYARENDALFFTTAKITDFLLTRAESENITRLKNLANIRRLILQTTPGLRDKQFLDADFENGELYRLRLKDPSTEFLQDYYNQMLLNTSLAFPDEESMQKYLIPAAYVEIPIQEIGSGTNHRLEEEKRLMVFRFVDIPTTVIASAKTLKMLLDVCLLKLRNVVVNSAQNRLVEDLVKDMRNIMPQKTTTVERITRLLSSGENENPLYFVNLANRLAAYFTIDKDKRGMATLIQAARLVEAFKGYEVWLEGEKNNKDRQRENSLKLLDIMADHPALLNREGIIQKVIQGSAGLEIMASSMNNAEIEQVLQTMLSEFTVFQPDEQTLLPALLKFKLNDEDFFIHREAVLIFFESERKRVSALLLARFRKMWYALMLRNESRSSMEFDEFFAEDVEKYVKAHEPIFSLLLKNPQTILNAFHIQSRHPVVANLQNVYFFNNERLIFRPVHMLLGLNRRDIFLRTRAELPFLFRYPFLRWLASLFGLLGSEALPTPETASTEEESHSSVPSDTDWHRALNMVETRLTGEKSVQELRDKYSEAWNLKLGDARKQLAERIDKDVEQRAKRLFSMTRKLPEVTQQFMRSEIENAATQLVRRYANDTAEPRAFKQYIQLTLIEMLKHIR